MKPSTEKDWEQFMAVTRDRYYYIIFKIVHDREETEDILQDTYMNLFINQDKYDNLTKVGSSIAFNRAINSYRSKIRKGQHVLEKGLLSHLNDSLVDEGDAYEWKDLLDKVLDIISDGKQASYLKLYVEGYSYKEISDMHSVSIGTVKSAIHATRKKLLSKINIAEIY